MPFSLRLDLQARLNDDRFRVPIFITAHGDQRVRMRALRAGAMEFLEKPVDREELLDTLRAAQGALSSGGTAARGVRSVDVGRIDTPPPSGTGPSAGIPLTRKPTRPRCILPARSVRREHPTHSVQAARSSRPGRHNSQPSPWSST
jgi:DNA-binding response OmpR family regulator